MRSAPPPPLAVDVTPLRESPGFRRLWVGQSIAYVAWRMMLVLVPVQVYRLTGSTLDVGLVSLVQFVPLVLFTIVGGALADAHDRRRLLVWSTAGIAVACARVRRDLRSRGGRASASSSSSASSRGRRSRSAPAPPAR